MQFITKFGDTDNNIQIGNNWYYLEENTRNFARKIGLVEGCEVEFNTKIIDGKKYVDKFTKWIVKKEQLPRDFDFIKNTSYKEEQDVRNYKIEAEWAYKVAVPMAVAEYNLSKKEYNQQEFLDKVEAFQDYILNKLYEKVNRRFSDE